MKFTYPIRIAVLSAVSCTLFAAEPGVEAAKQALDAKWQKLRPDHVKERNVLFQSVRYLGGAGTAYQYQVTALIRDYDAGYPANKYYGRTCVGTIQDLRYKLWSDGTNWQVDGVMTPPQSKCQDNPSAGASAIPLASLSGTPAATGRPAAAPAPPRSGGMVLGAYECWSGSSARMMLNFTVQPGSQYVDSQGKRGSFSIDPATSRVTFRGGLLDGGIPAGMYAVYHERNGRPTLSLRGRDGGESAFCEK